MDDSGERTGFNAAVAGCFFALESVLLSSTTDAVPSLTTAMLLLSSVLASVVSQAGLGSDPAFKIPAYDFRSPAGKQSTQFCILQNCTISYPHKLLAASMTALLTMLCLLSSAGQHHNSVFPSHSIEKCDRNSGWRCYMFCPCFQS